MYYFYQRDDKPTLKIERVGGYSLEGDKLDLNPNELMLDRYRVTIEYEFSDCYQEDGHSEPHGDSLRGFAEVVADQIKIDKTEFVEKYKEHVAAQIKRMQGCFSD